MKKSLTARYMNGTGKDSRSFLKAEMEQLPEDCGARENNLTGIDVKFPLNVFTVVTGVSGSGKSTLISSILYPALNKKINGTGEKPGKHDLLEGDHTPAGQGRICESESHRKIIPLQSCHLSESF